MVRLAGAEQIQVERHHIVAEVPVHERVELCPHVFDVSVPIRSDPIRSDPIRSDPIRSDPIRSDPFLDSLMLLDDFLWSIDPSDVGTTPQ